MTDAARLGQQNIQEWADVLDRAVAQVSGDPMDPPDPTPVPELSSIALMAAALAACVDARRRRGT